MWGDQPRPPGHVARVNDERRTIECAGRRMISLQEIKKKKITPGQILTLFNQLDLVI